MIVSSTHLFTQIRACIGLCAKTWGVSLPTAYIMCYDAAAIIAGRLSGFHTPYKFPSHFTAILEQPLNARTFAMLSGYALPIGFFGQDELTYWQKTYPNQPPKNTLCVVGLLLLWIAYHDVPPLMMGKAVSASSHTQTATLWGRFDSLSYEQKAWLFVGVFLGVLGLVIWQTRPEAPPQDDKPKTQKPIQDVAIIRIDDKKSNSDKP